MGLIDRLWRAIRANITSLVSQAEDPEKILEQAVDDMQQELINLRQAVAGAIATQKRTERQCSQNRSSAAEWYRRAQLALQAGNEELARQALTKRKTYQETEEAQKAQLEQQSGIVTRLKRDMKTLEGKISEARMKKDMYIARARSAQATQRLQEMLGNTNASTSLNAFERMEDKVLQLEAQSEAIASLNADELEKQFLSVEDTDEVDDELAAMKAQMLSGNNPPQLEEGERD
jgi:phage shock protein A